MQKPETKLRKLIIEALEEEFPSGLFSKIHGSPFQEAGISDIVCSVHGRFIGLEVKRPTKEPTPIQQSWGNRVLKSGGHWAVVYNGEQAIQEVKKALRNNLTPY